MRKNKNIRRPTPNNKKVRRPVIRNKKVKTKVPPRRWTPANLDLRFPTEADILLGDMSGDFSKIYADAGKLAKAQRWKSNYIKAFSSLMEALSGEDLDSDLQDDIDSLYWDIMQMDIIDFLKGQSMYSEELSITAAYDTYRLQLNAQRIVERWQSVLS